MSRIKKILEYDHVVSQMMEERENRNLKGIYYIFWVVCFVFTTANIIQRSYSMMVTTAIMTIVLSIGLIINHIKMNNTLLRFLFTLLFFVMFTIYIIKGGNEGFASLWIVVFSYPLMAIIDLKMGFVCCLGWEIVLLLFFSGPLRPYLQYEYQPMFLVRFPILYLSTFACATFIAVRFRQFQYYALTTNKELEMIGNKDELTGIQNIRGLRSLIESGRFENCNLAAAMIDIDDFKQINDTYGHDIGDQVLQCVAEQLKKNFRQKDVLVRRGGDEFLVLLHGMEEKEYDLIAEKIAAIII